MDLVQKLAGTAEFMEVEDSDEQAPASPPSEYQAAPSSPAGAPACFTPQKQEMPPVFHAKMSGGKTIPLLKTVLTSACERNCYYCAFRAGRDFRRQTFKPDEMAQVHMQMYDGGAVRGLFLSSGIAGGGLRTQDRLIDTAEILRSKYQYPGYLHLKVMPGAEKDQVIRAMQLADRVSVNLEAPTADTLGRLAPQKVLMEELLQPLRWIEEIRQSKPDSFFWNGRKPSSTTQFVVGAVGESDLELLKATAYLYSRLKLSRAYFSGFRPVRGTPLEEGTRVNPWRTYRLYQASFLLRDYGFSLEDFEFQGSGELPLEVDPKVAWANVNLSERPVEINRAGFEDLLRVPGIGRQSARAIMAARRSARLLELSELTRLGVVSGRAAPFILLAGRRPSRQLRLF